MTMLKDPAEVVAQIKAQLDEWTKGKIDPIREEVERMAAQLKASLASDKERRREAIARRDPGADRIIGGPYDGLHRFDLHIMQSLVQAQMQKSVGYDARSLTAWQERLNAALSSDTADQGDELVPTAMAPNLWQDVELESVMLGWLPRTVMPTNPFTLPLSLGPINWFPTEENTAATETTPATGAVTITAYELAGEVNWSYTLDEDAVVSMLPEIRSHMVREAAMVIDDVLLNADTVAGNANINRQGAAITKATAGFGQYLLGFNSLIKQALVTGPGSNRNNKNGAIAADDLLSLRGDLGKYGVRTQDIAFFCDISSYIKLLGLSEAETVDKFGPSATILTGQLGSIYGVPILVSEQMKLSNTDGKVSMTAANNTKGRILTANRSQWRTGFRREISLETDRDISKRQNKMVTSFRLGLTQRDETPADAEHTALTYNITV